MPNFIQTCYLAKDFHSKSSILPVEKINPETKAIRYTGELSWLDGKNKDGKNKYQKLRFYTFDKGVFDLMVSNPNAAFDIEGFIKTSFKKDPSKDEGRFHVDIQVVKASVHQKSENHWQDR